MRARNDGAAARGGREPPAVVQQIATSPAAEADLGKRARLMLPWELGRPAGPISELWNGRDAERRASRGRRLCIGTNAKARQHQVHEPGLRFRPNSAVRLRPTAPAARRSHSWRVIVPRSPEPAMPMAT